LLGRGAGAAAGGIEALPNIKGRIPTPSGTTLARGAATASLVGRQQDGLLSPGGQWKYDIEQKDWVPNVPETPVETATQPALSDEVFRQIILADLLETGGKIVDQIIKVREALVPGTGGAISNITEKKQIDLANSGLRALDQAEALLKEDPSLVIKRTIPGKIGARSYDSALFRSIEAILRGRSGAAVPEQEVRRYMSAYAPKIGDSKETAKLKLEALRADLLDLATPIGQTKGGGTDDISALMGALGM